MIKTHGYFIFMNVQVPLAILCSTKKLNIPIFWFFFFYFHETDENMPQSCDTESFFIYFILFYFMHFWINLVRFC